MVGCIYRIYNKVNGNYYIGSTSNVSRRRNTHFRELRNGTHINPHLQRAFNKYGEDVFEFEILEYCKTIEGRLQKEQYLLNEAVQHMGMSCYNICKTAGSPFVKGRKKSNEHKQKLSEATRKYFEKHPEAREKIRQQHLGMKASEETKEKLRMIRKRGPEHHNSKLDEDDVRYIRKSYIPREVSQRTLAKKYGVDKTTIARIIQRKTWTHI